MVKNTTSEGTGSWKPWWTPVPTAPMRLSPHKSSGQGYQGKVNSRAMKEGGGTEIGYPVDVGIKQESRTLYESCTEIR